MDLKTTRKLNNGVEMPIFGLGVFRSPEGKETSDAVRWAIESGYIHVDTAKIYGNEKSVAQGIRDSGIARDKLFITTKLWNDDMRRNRQMAAVDESLDALGVDYIDLYLIHWPVENYIESWKCMEKILASGKAKAVGVSNFQTHHLDKLLAETAVVPAVNQVEFHPFLTQEPLRKYCAEKGIVFEAYMPLGGQGGNVLSDPTMTDIAARHGKSPAQVALRWDLQHDVVTIPKSVHQKRIVENADVFGFELTADEMAAIDKLNKNHRFCADPDNFDF